MTQYVDSEYRQVDGPNYNKWFFGVPLTNMREVVSNDFSGTTSIGADGSAGLAITTVLHKHSTPNLEFVNGDTDSCLQLEWIASNSDAVAFQVPLPPWLDCSEDLYIKFKAVMGGTTDSGVVASDAYFDKGDTKVEDNSGTVTSTTAADYTITIASADIPIGARAVSVELTPFAHTTDTFVMYSCWVEGKLIP